MRAAIAIARLAKLAGKALERFGTPLQWLHTHTHTHRHRHTHTHRETHTHCARQPGSPRLIALQKPLIDSIASVPIGRRAGR